jgi:hypothetical protein
VIVVVFRIAREPGQVIALLAEQTDPLEAVISEEVVIASAIAAFQAVPGPEAGAASGAVPEASAGAARAQAVAAALPAWGHHGVALEAVEAVAAAAVVVGGGSEL